jgi:hypothetical protein
MNVGQEEMEAYQGMIGAMIRRGQEEVKATVRVSQEKIEAARNPLGPSWKAPSKTR